MTKFLNISTDNTLGGSSASDVLVASQKAVKDYVDAHGGGGSVAIDGTTITRNTDSEIQTVAVINGNTASGATNPIYDWVGTVEEYTSQAVATTHPDWLCFITNKNHSNLSHYLVAAQYPDASNGYTWYFLYSDGWVEQGGNLENISNGYVINLPITMAVTRYTVGLLPHATGNYNLGYNTPTTTSITVYTSYNGAYFSWEVKGMAAS